MQLRSLANEVLSHMHFFSISLFRQHYYIVLFKKGETSSSLI
jgi:hypothetical protein